MDRISNLPDGIVIHILSFLSTEEAASTSLLSKRWRHMFAFSPNLQFTFDDPDKWDSLEIFIDFVDRVLAVSGNSAVRRFNLKCRDEGVGSAHTNRWIRNILRRGSVLDLDLDVFADDSVPFEVFSCKTLVNLKLGGRFEIHMSPNTKTTSLPALKSFSLYSPHFDSLYVYEKLVSTCPVLEEFIIDQIEWPLQNWPRLLSVPSLKRLTINTSIGQELGSLSFDLPNLVYLCYDGFVQLKYSVVNLDSLVEAELGIITQDGDLDRYDILSLIKGLKNVKILNLARRLTLQNFIYYSEAMPVFENLIHLSITTDAHDCIAVSCLPSLLKKFPNLQTLVVEGRLFDNFNFCKCTSRCSCLVSCGVKVLEFTEYKGSISELHLMKRFLEELSCLELVKIRVKRKDGQERLRVTKDLLRLPITSSKCKIQIQSVVT